jgi:Pectate lyase superfamily protein
MATWTVTVKRTGTQYSGIIATNPFEALQAQFPNQDIHTDRIGNVVVTSTIGSSAEFFVDGIPPIGGAAGALLAANNLSDVANAATSLANLGGLSKAANLSDIANPATALANLGGISGSSVAATYLAKANNLSDLANVSTALGNLGFRVFANVVAYGADPTGVADSTTAINNAVAAAAGGTVYFPNGNYKVTGSITLSPFTCYQGESKFSTIIKAANSASIPSGIFFADTLGSYTTICDLTIDGNSANSANTNGVNAAGLSYVTVQNCIVQNINNNGVTISQNGANNQNPYFGAVRGCYFANIGAKGISFSQLSNGIAENNMMNIVGESGINLAWCWYCTVSGNTMIGGYGTPNTNGYAGVRITSGPGPSAAGYNTVTGNSMQYFSRGIFILGAQFTTVIGNAILFTYAEGILVDTSTTAPIPDGFNTVIGNTIAGTGQGAPSGSTYGITCTQNKNIIIGNTILDANSKMEYGIGFLANAYANANGNFASGNYMSGQTLGDMTATNPGLSNFGPNITGTGTVNGGKSIASAGTITLPYATDVFTITGTTNITAINGGYFGRVVTLIFSGALTVSNGGALNIQGGTFATSAGSALTLRHVGNQWYEIGRKA